jgi:hypothetical protein
VLRTMRVDHQGLGEGILKGSVEMSNTRRDFIINLGISIATLVLTRCASYQDSSTTGAEPPSTDNPIDPKNPGSISSKPTTLLSQDANPMTAERRSNNATEGQIQDHTTTLEEWQECGQRNDPTLTPYDRLRLCWENLSLLESNLYDPNWQSVGPREMLIDCHTETLQDLVVMGELGQEGAREMHEAFLAAIHYILTNSVEVV